MTQKAQSISRGLAETRLRKRYYQQALCFPTMWHELPLDAYISANVANVMEYGLLADYDREPNWHPIEVQS